MNKKEKILNRKKNWCKYHVQSCSNLHRLKIDAIFISTANSLEHELKKLEVCYEIKKKGHSFITEAERCKLDENKKKRRVDVVDIDSGEEYEIETDPKRAERFKGEKKVNVVMVEK